jgi:hypothetical protein
VVAARVALVLLAAAALAGGWQLGRDRDAASGSPAGHYACPMHPAAVSATSAGACPICRMALKPLGAARERAAIADSELGTLTTIRVTREVSAPSWVDGARAGSALFYGDELALLAPDELALVYLVGAATPIRVRLDDAPAIKWDGATWRRRWRVVAGERARGAVGGELARGAVGWLTLPRRDRPAHVLPYGSVLSSPAGPYVLVVDGRVVVPRAIVTGRALFDFVTVVGGLGGAERVVTRDAVWRDAERRLAAATEAAP